MKYKGAKKIVKRITPPLKVVNELVFYLNYGVLPERNSLFGIDLSRPVLSPEKMKDKWQRNVCVDAWSARISACTTHAAISASIAMPIHRKYWCRKTAASIAMRARAFWDNVSVTSIIQKTQAQRLAFLFSCILFSLSHLHLLQNLIF